MSTMTSCLPIGPSENDPFTPTIQGDDLVGGAMDMKGQESPSWWRS
jgi:hypothetical protein